MGTHPFIQNLQLLRHNLATVERLFQKYPNLFEHFSHVQLDNEKPVITVWSWDGTSEKKQAIAAAHRNGKWKRKATQERIDYIGEIEGVEFVLEGAEPAPQPAVTPLFTEA